MSGLWLANLITKKYPNTSVTIYEKTKKLGGRFIMEKGFLTGAEIIHYKDSSFYKYVVELLKKTNNEKKMKQCDSYLYCGENVDVCEFWKNGDNFSIFATASRADVLNSFTVFEINKFIEEMVLDIFKIKISVQKVYKKYWTYGYHYPSMKDKTKYKKGKYSCGEWLSPKFDATISSAIDSAEKTFRDLERDGYLK